MGIISLWKLALCAHIALIPSSHAEAHWMIPEKCCKVPAPLVPHLQKRNWCDTQKDTCETICANAPRFFLARWVDNVRGQSVVKENSCDADTLEYTCKCSSGLYPTMTEANSIPGRMCRFWFDSCMQQAGSSAAAQFACIQARDANCGKKQAAQEKRQARPATPTPTPSFRYSSSSTPYSTPRSTPRPNTTPTPSPEPDDPSPSPGAIAGIVIGCLAGVGALAFGVWFCLRRRRRGGPTNMLGQAEATNIQYSEKQVVDPKSPTVSKQNELPELQAHGIQPPTATYAPHQVGEVQQQAGYHNPAELPPSTYMYPSQAKPPYQPTNYGYQTATPPQPPGPRPELEANVPPYAAVPIPVYNDQPAPQPYQSPPLNETRETYSNLPEPIPSAIPAQLSQEDIAALQEEERRIDAEMEEVQRMKALRDQKFAIQQKLREARNG